jgi:hypothetical protein
MSMSSLSPKSVNLLLAQWNAGDDEALHAVLPLVYEELRRLARHYMRGERADHTLQGTALVHEAYLRLEKQGAVRFNDRSHIVAICAQLMRQTEAGTIRFSRRAPASTSHCPFASITSSVWLTSATESTSRFLFRLPYFQRTTRSTASKRASL